MRSLRWVTVVLMAALAAGGGAQALGAVRRHPSPGGAAIQVSLVEAATGKPTSARVVISWRHGRQHKHSVKRAGRGGRFSMRVAPGVYHINAQTPHTVGVATVRVSGGVANVSITMHRKHGHGAAHVFAIGLIKRRGHDPAWAQHHHGRPGQQAAHSSPARPAAKPTQNHPVPLTQH